MDTSRVHPIRIAFLAVMLPIVLWPAGRDERWAEALEACNRPAPTWAETQRNLRMCEVTTQEAIGGRLESTRSWIQSWRARRHELQSAHHGTEMEVKTTLDNIAHQIEDAEVGAVERQRWLGRYFPADDSLKQHFCRMPEKVAPPVFETRGKTVAPCQNY